MKRFQISFEFSSSYAKTLDAPNIQEALYGVMQELKPFGHIEPREGTIHLKEIPFATRELSLVR